MLTEMKLRVKSKRTIRPITVFSLLFMLTLVIWSNSLPSFQVIDVAIAAQTAGDSLPTSVSTPGQLTTSIPALPFTTNSVEKIWVGRLVNNIPGATRGEGSIFRVSIAGVLDTPIELRTDDKLIVANSGSKPEYGRYAAEFAPVTAGVWTVNVPALEVSLDVVADNFNLAIIEFVEVSEIEATQTVMPPATPTPLDGLNWEGEIISEALGAAGPGARLLVRVVGRDNYPVRLSTISQVVNTANTGQKSDELGPNIVEFAGLTPGKYIVEPVGLNVSVEVELKPFVETKIEFRPSPIPPTPTSTAVPLSLAPLLRATFTSTPILPSSTPSEFPTPTETAFPTVTPLPLPLEPTASRARQPTYWLGVITSRIDTISDSSSITVRVEGIEGLSVRLHSQSGTLANERRCLTGQGGVGQDGCLFRDLPPGQYIIEPEGLRVSLPLLVFPHETVTAELSIQSFPLGITGWQAQLNKNTNSFQVTTKAESIITARVADGQAGQVISLRSTRGPTRYCEVVHNPVVGGLICEFGQLGPGIYTVEAATTGASFKVFVDGQGETEVEFSPSATEEILTLLKSPSLVGQGANPRQVVTVPAATRSSIIVVNNRPPTASPTPTIQPTSTPAFAWQGHIIETGHTGVGAIGVRAAGLKDHPVVLSSGSWQSQPQLTGTKVELGEYATEFGGLASGEYLVQLVDLVELKVNLEPGQFMLVEFRYDFVTPP